MPQPYNLITILGPTASGKTALAVRIAAALDTEIISADSRQVYIGMDIGTGKDLRAYRVNGRVIPCHLIDIVKPTEDFSVYDFQQHFYRAHEKITAKGRVPVLAGGTGLYLDCALRGYMLLEAPENPELRKRFEDLPLAEILRILERVSPTLHNITDTQDRERAIRAVEIHQFETDHPDLFVEHPPIHSLTFGIACDRERLRQRIGRRLRERIENGMIDEAKRLRETGLSWERFNYFGLEYRYMAQYLQRQINLQEMEDLLATRISQFAKRQETWFRKMEREGLSIIWIGENDHKLVMRILHEEGFL